MWRQLIFKRYLVIGWKSNYRREAYPWPQCDESSDWLSYDKIIRERRVVNLCMSCMVVREDVEIRSSSIRLLVAGKNIVSTTCCPSVIFCSMLWKLGSCDLVYTVVEAHCSAGCLSTLETRRRILSCITCVVATRLQPEV